MRLSIQHKARYTYSGPLAHGLMRLRLTPKETQGQRVSRWAMAYEGAAQELTYDDQNCNHVTLISIREGVREVVITCSGEVETQDQAEVIGQHSGHLPLWAFLGQTALTRPGPRIRQLISRIEPREAGTLEVLHLLSHLVRKNVPYVAAATHVATTAEEALGQRGGVCQDHAHVFIAAARALDIPARYVSGYLLIDALIDDALLVGGPVGNGLKAGRTITSQATHAWAEAHVENLGWVGFDVANGISPDPRHVRLATGRDYRDAAPIGAISHGAHAAALCVDLAVEQRGVAQ